MSEFGMDGIAQITAERVRHVTEHGYTIEHDQSHDDGSLLEAAMCYLIYGGYVAQGILPTESELPSGPRWEEGWFKPDQTDAIPNLVKAGSLIAAEIDRLLRA